MTQYAMRRLLALYLAALFTTVCVSAQGNAALVGKWHMVSESDGDPVKWTLILKDNDGKLAGFLATEEGEQLAKEFVYQDGVIKFKAQYQSEDYEITLTVKDDKLTGTWRGGGNSGKTTGTKDSAG